MECSTWWSQLPDDLKENTLAWLPVESLCRYRCLCKEWNALISSTKFITKDWVAAPPNNKPWLVLCHRWRLLCMGYCFFTNTWKRFSLAFLREKYDFSDIWIHGSAAGLVLASTWVHGPIRTHSLSNPLTGTSLELPRINDSTLFQAMTIVAGERQGHNGETYKVIAVAESGNAQRVEIYDSCLKSWSTAGQLPQNMRILHTALDKVRIVISEDFLYCKGWQREVRFRYGIIAFSVQNGTSIFMRLPLEDVPDRNRRDVLFSCGSRVLLGTCIRYRGVEDIIISELQKPALTSNFLEGREIARIPPSILEDFDIKEDMVFGSLMFDFEATRDLVCITYGRANEVLVYNLSENTWRWLQRRPMDKQWLYVPYAFVFEPRLDMKVE
jgi:hypothetical protein